jgi:hypothetical protein
MPTERAFPWVCPSCLNKTVEESVIDYHVEIKHKGKLVCFLIHGLRIPKCRSCYNLLFSLSVDDQIQAALENYLKEMPL